MYIRNWEKENIPFSYKGKKHIFPADSLIYVDEEEIPYSVLASAFGSHRLSKIDEKYVVLNENAIGSNFDEFLEEEGIKEEVEQKALEKLEEIKSITVENEIDKTCEGICLGNLVPVENAEDLSKEYFEENEKQEEVLEKEIKKEISSELIKEKTSRRSGRRSNKDKN